MKPKRGLMWYLFAVYAINVWINYDSMSSSEQHSSKGNHVSSHRHHHATLIRCIVLSEFDVKIERKECKVIMNNLRKHLAKVLQSAASHPTLSTAFASVLSQQVMIKSGKQLQKHPNKLTDNGGKAAAFLASALHQIVRKINQKENEHWVRYFGIAIMTLAILLALVVGPILTCSQPVYVITVVVFAFLVTFYSSLLVRWVVHHLLRLCSLNRLHLWILPNLNEDVGLIDSFCPIYTADLKHRHRIEVHSDKTIDVQPDKQAAPSQEQEPNDDAEQQQTTDSTTATAPTTTTDNDADANEFGNAVQVTDKNQVNDSKFEEIPLDDDHFGYQKHDHGDNPWGNDEPQTKCVQTEKQHEKRLQDEFILKCQNVIGNQTQTNNDSTIPKWSNMAATIDTINFRTDSRRAIAKSVAMSASVFRECKQLIQSTFDKQIERIDGKANDSGSEDFEILNEHEIMGGVNN